MFNIQGAATACYRSTVVICIVVCIASMKMRASSAGFESCIRGPGIRGPACQLHAARQIAARFCCAQVVASQRGSGSAFQHGTQLLGAAIQQALGPNANRLALQCAASTADGLAVMYVIDAMRASSRQQGSTVQPKHIELEW